MMVELGRATLSILMLIVEIIFIINPAINKNKLSEQEIKGNLLASVPCIQLAYKKYYGFTTCFENRENHDS